MSDAEFKEEQAGIWAVLRAVIGFQFKLFADGMRDLLLSPVSIVAALVGIVSRPDDPGYLFRRLMAFGVRTDRWINLFGAHNHLETGEYSSDKVLQDVEGIVISEYRKRAQRPPSEDP